jgi:glycosyltransferase involved in cell wall biosynthesis
LSRSDAIAHRVRELYWESPSLQYIYAKSASAAAAFRARTGQDYAALEEYCNAIRRVRSPELRNKGIVRLNKFLSTRFGQSTPATLEDNVFVRAFSNSNAGIAAKAKLKKLPPDRRVNLQGNLLVLKLPSANERGVLLVQYNYAIEQFLVNFKLADVCRRYAIVLEPSWGKIPEPYWALYCTADTPVLCEIISAPACDLMRASGVSLVPLAMGAHDWVHDEIFRPLPEAKKEFDLVMIAGFARLKRHNVLFRAMNKIGKGKLRVALIGRTMERTRQEFDEEMRAYGVLEDCIVFQGLGPQQVNDVLNRSKVNLLLSKAEAGNRGIMEGFAAGVPCIVYKHIVGPRHEDINADTGVFSDDEELAASIQNTLANYTKFRPREWFSRNTGFRRSAATLNSALKAEFLKRGEAWTTDIVQKANMHESRYISPGDALRMKPGFDELATMLVEL